MKSRFTTSFLTRCAILAAAAAVLALIEIPVVAFYKLDLGNIPVLLGAFALGPTAGVLILLLKCLINLLHTSSAGIGQLADFIMGLALILPAAIVYRQSKTRKAALTGLALGTICMIIVSVFVNKWIMLPFYMGAFHMDMAAVIKFAGIEAVDSEWKLLLMITAPFNLLKGVVLSVITALIYKPLSPVLHSKN